MTVVCIHQPDFLPWLGFFDRLMHSDIFIILDNVQFLRRGWHHRDKIKTANGSLWLTVPVKKKGRYKQLINQVEIDNDRDWRSQHLKSFATWYGAAPYFPNVFSKLSLIYKRSHRLLIDLNMALLNFLSTAFGIQTKFIFASTRDVTGTQNEYLVNLVRSVEGDIYLSGTGARAYLDEAKFAKAGISVMWQEFDHPIYPQLFDQFIPRLSSIDFMFNCYPEAPNFLRAMASVSGARS